MKYTPEALQLLENNKKEIKDVIAFIESCITIKIAKMIKENEEKIQKNLIPMEEISKQYELRIKNKAFTEVIDILMESD